MVRVRQRRPIPTPFQRLWARSEVKEIVSFAKTLVLFLLAALFLRASVVEAFKIPSGSMMPTLQIGDHILVSKLSYGFRLPLVAESLWQYDRPSRGDIVVFTRPANNDSLDEEVGINIIKRVVALPGETVEVRNRTVLINGQPLDEPFARWAEGGIPEGEFGPAQVPADHIFLLGDNRDHSKDSRFWDDPFLPLEYVKGRALFIYWSKDSLSRIGMAVR